MKWITQIAIYLVIVTLLLLRVIVPKIAFADSNTAVNATVRISVCGNFTAEGGEDCDNTDLKGKTCQSLGYGGGSLSCDISCSYDTSICVLATPTPSLIPTAAPVQPLIPTVTSSPQQQGNVQTIPTDMPTVEISISPISLTTTTQPTLLQTFFSSVAPFPKTLLFFGADQDGKIAKQKLYTSVKSWVQEWQTFTTAAHAQNGKVRGTKIAPKCDINKDGVCDIKDFSIMMYYIQP